MKPELRRVLSRYVVFQLPEFFLVGLVLTILVGLNLLEGNLGWLLLVAWILKEIVLFPLVRRAYEPTDPSGAASLLGESAVVVQRLDPRGTVRLGPELWAACLQTGTPPAEIGTTVCVKSVEGLTLHVVSKNG